MIVSISSTVNGSNLGRSFDVIRNARDRRYLNNIIEQDHRAIKSAGTSVLLQSLRSDSFLAGAPIFAENGCGKNIKFLQVAAEGGCYSPKVKFTLVPEPMKSLFAPALALSVTALVLPMTALGAPPSPETPAPTPVHSARYWAAPHTVATQGAVTVGTEHIRYTADAGTLVLHDESNKPTGEMFYVAYFKDGAQATERPITFLYNGGPGSSSALLLMGSFGPVLVVTSSDNNAAPYPLANNGNSLLDATDLVFVDAVGTGFSRILGADEGGVGTRKTFYGVDPDAKSFAQFVEQFLSKYARWNSPKFLIGQSYGTTRSAVLAYVLEEDGMIPLNGIVLMGTILNFDLRDVQPSPGLNLPYALALPTYAATAWYHKTLPHAPENLTPWLDEVQSWAMGPYLAALNQGPVLPQAEKERIAARMSRYTGLPESYILHANLRVNEPQFEQELLLAKGKNISSLDARFTGLALDPLSEYAEYDSELGYLGWAYTTAVNDYVRKALRFGGQDEYVFWAPDIFDQWDYSHTPPGAGAPANSATNVMADIAFDMTVNPRLKVMLNSGYFDLDTPYYASVYEMQQLPMSPSLQKNIEYRFYQTGHMINIAPGALPQLHADIAQFIRDTVHSH